jgi:anti-sigma B factor antagonist
MRDISIKGDGMGTAPRPTLQYEIEKSKDELSNNVTTVKCQGRIVSETAAQLKEAVKPLIPAGGRILIDLTDVQHIDSSGLGTLVGLKVSAVNAGYCRLELVNLSPRVADLLRLTKLTQLFAP